PVDYGVTYRFTVSAENDVGIGPPSNEVVVTPQPMVSIGRATVVEGNAGTSQLHFDVSLDGPSAQTVSVFFQTAGDTTATPGADFVPTFGTVTFVPGTTHMPVFVTVKGDTLYEANEIVKVRLSSPVNAVLRHNVGAGTIVNDDAAPTVSIADLARAEGSRVGPTPFRMVVPLSSMSGADAKVSWSTANGSAIAPGDY